MGSSYHHSGRPRQVETLSPPLVDHCHPRLQSVQLRRAVRAAHARPALTGSPPLQHRQLGLVLPPQMRAPRLAAVGALQGLPVLSAAMMLQLGAVLQVCLAAGLVWAAGVHRLTVAHQPWSVWGIGEV